MENKEITQSIENDILDEATRYKLLYLKTNSELIKSRITNIDLSMQNLKNEGELLINKVNENERKLDNELNEYCIVTFGKPLKEISEDYILDLDSGSFKKKNK